MITDHLVPEAGIEPARTCVHWCLRPTRLPIPPFGLSACKDTNTFHNYKHYKVAHLTKTD